MGYRWIVGQGCESAYSTFTSFLTQDVVAVSPFLIYSTNPSPCPPGHPHVSLSLKACDDTNTRFTREDNKISTDNSWVETKYRRFLSLTFKPFAYFWGKRAGVYWKTSPATNSDVRWLYPIRRVRARITVVFPHIKQGGSLSITHKKPYQSSLGEHSIILLIFPLAVWFTVLSSFVKTPVVARGPVSSI